MTVHVERPYDGGSAVWSCTTCEGGGWCSDHTTALIEARTHAQGHKDKVTIVGARRGPRPNLERDEKIRTMRTNGSTIRTIATTVGISAAGVMKALRRTA
ncbi:hypothetical protein V8Z69_07545 [Microbacterium aurugineum]|uniref:hypothetical protein n=1 Tax=Microbacterium aurugineum TaxID=2851642 RepID=UPI0039BEB914